MNLKTSRPVGWGVLAGVMLLLSPGMTPAQLTCNGAVAVSYVSGPSYSVPGDIRRVRIKLGTGSISGGSLLTIQRVKFDLDCNSNFPLTLPLLGRHYQISRILMAVETI